MGRAPCCDKASVKRGPWSPEEDAKLKEFIDKHGTGGNWIALPHKAGLKRCGKSCRLRWLNYLRPNIKHGEFSEDEDRVIYNLYASIGSRWSIIASHLPGRTDNDIKNYWNTKLRKKLLAMLPSIQKKPSFFPSMPLQSPPVSDTFLNASSSFYNFNTSYLTNVSNNINSLLSGEERVNIVAKISGCVGGGDGLSTTTTTNVTNLLSNPLISNEKQYLGFQNHNMNKEYYNYNFPEVEERMLMFGYSGGEMSASCSSASSQITYNKDHHDHGFMADHNYIDQKQKGCKNLDEVKQLMGVNSYLMNDHDDDENKTTHIITDGFYRMIDGGN